MMRRFPTWMVFVLALPTLLLWASGCGSACEDLANKVCDCQPTRAKKQRCKINVDAASRNFDLSDEQEDRCQQILDEGGCTCEALEAGHLSACGLSYDPAAEPS